MADLIAPPGYESDTGERDNPSYEHFRTNTPVTRTIELKAAQKRLNREGRAICRIVNAHGWPIRDIAGIFDVSETTVARVVENVVYSGYRDFVSEDYARVRDPAFEKYFPPVPRRQLQSHPAMIEVPCSEYQPDSEGAAAYSSNGRPSRMAKEHFYKNLSTVERGSALNDALQAQPHTPTAQVSHTALSHPVAEAGYESDTGERDNPTSHNFKTGEPVEKTITVAVGGQRKVLNREGRAICRIAHAHGWSFSEIANIFGVSDASVSRAVENVRYNPRDRISEDYVRVRDPDFAKLFPRGVLMNDADSTYVKPQSETRAVNRSSGKPSKRCHVDHNRGGNTSSASTAKKPRYGNEDIPDLQFRRRSNPSVFRGLPGIADTSVLSASRNPGNTHVSAPRRPPPPSSAPQQTLSSFLRDVLTMDLSTHRAFLQAQGFSMLRLHVMAGSWPHPTIAEALERTLMGSKVVGARWTTLTALEVITLELGIRKLKPKLPAGSTPRPLTSPLPGPSSNSCTSAITLLSFLENVMGFDLTEHHDLLKNQGFDVAFLRGMTTWHNTDLQEALRRSATGKVHVGRGMSALDVLALEFALREIGKERLLD